MEDLVAVILAGGQSTRFGSDKLHYRLNNKELLLHVYEVVSSVLPCVYLIGKKDSSNSSTATLHWIEDEIKDLGPIGGLYTAMVKIPARNYFICAGDMPFIQPGMLHLLVNSHQQSLNITVAKSSRGLEPLFAVYNSSNQKLIVEQIQKKEFSLHKLFVKAAIKVVNFDIHGYISQVFFNINSTSDVKNAEKIKQNSYR